MKFKLLLLALIMLIAVDSVYADDQQSPTVELSYPANAALGESFSIEISISNTYIESSIFIVDVESRPGWTETEQGYFSFVPSQYDIELLLADQDLELTFECDVSASAPEKEYTIPFVFYGKAGECAEGCVPFRLTYDVMISVIDPAQAPEKESLGDNAFAEESYATAKMYYQQALARYEAVNDNQNSANVSEKISFCDIGSEALQFYESGKNKCDIGNYEGAKSDLESAKEKYTTIGNEQKISDIDSLLQQCSQTTPVDDESSGFPLTYIVIGVIVIAIVALVGIKKIK